MGGIGGRALRYEGDLERHAALQNVPAERDMYGAVGSMRCLFAARHY